MTHRSLLVAIALLAPAAAAAQDGDVSRNLAFEGVAPRACVAGAVTTVSQDNVQIRAEDGGRVRVTFSPTGFVDQANGTVQPASFTLAVPVLCNGPASVRVASTRGALLRDGPASTQGQLGGRVDFTLRVGLGGLTESFVTSDRTAASLNIPGAVSENATLALSIERGRAPLLAGTYSDTIVFEVAPGN